MRHLEARLVDPLVAVEQEVEVDRARAEARAVARAAEPPLDPEQPVEERRGRELGLDARRRVQEAGLVA